MDYYNAASNPSASHGTTVDPLPLQLGPDHRDEDDSQSEIDDEVPQHERPLLSHSDELDDGAKNNKISPRTAGQAGNGRRKPLKRSEIIWVTATTLLISTLVYSSQIFVILPYYRNTATFSLGQLLALLVPFNLFALLIYYNYYLCVTTNPGDVPDGWQPDWSALDTSLRPDVAGPVSMAPGTMELKSYAYKPRYCKTCRCYKPPRAHHCKTCGRCVLRMDHHCPWVANCVGHHNYGHFLRFLFYVDVSCTMHVVMLSMRVLDRWNTLGYWREPSTREMLLLVLNYALCIPVLLLVGLFSGYHFYCAAINQTTIESWEKDKVATMIRRGKIRKVRYPYNVSAYRNLVAVLGRSPLAWCLPKRMEGDGLRFDVAEGIEPSAQYRWPPRDPARLGQRDVAPPLFPLSGGGNGPGRASSAFTYGGEGFNPSLVPSNSALRHRHPGAPTDRRLRGGGGSVSSSSSSSSGTTITSGSDDDDDEGAVKFDPRRYDSRFLARGSTGPGLPPPPATENPWHEEDSEADSNDDDEEEEEERQLEPRGTRGGVRVRRGSEGYEVRSSGSRWIVDEPAFDVQASQSSDGRPLLPSQVMLQHHQMQLRRQAGLNEDEGERKERLGPTSVEHS